MSATLRVALNADGPNTLSGPTSAEVERDFSVVLENRGTDAHVHIRMNDPLSEVATITESNHFVEGGSELEIPITVEPGTSGGGILEVVTGYGATRHGIRVTVDAPENPEVEIDESLSKPRPPDEPAPMSRTGQDSSALPLGLLGAGLVIVAVFLAAASDVGAVIVAVIALVGAFAVAAYLLVQD
ncbi:MAG: hypothetical protein ABEJ35_07520 [Halobacteriaceae archaeon]